MYLHVIQSEYQIGSQCDLILSLPFHQLFALPIDSLPLYLSSYPLSNHLPSIHSLNSLVLFPTFSTCLSYPPLSSVLPPSLLFSTTLILYSHLSPMLNLPTLTHTQEKDRNLRRITRMVLVVVAVFIVCWTPIHIFVIITALINIPSSTLQTITWHFCIALGYTNRYTPSSCFDKA